MGHTHKMADCKTVLFSYKAGPTGGNRMVTEVKKNLDKNTEWKIDTEMRHREDVSYDSSDDEKGRTKNVEWFRYWSGRAEEVDVIVIFDSDKKSENGTITSRKDVSRSSTIARI